MSQPAPAFNLPDAKGQMHTLQSLKKPALLCFYKTECGTCELAFPFFEKLHRLYGPSVTMVGIAQNPAADAQDYASRRGATFLQLSDDDPYSVSAAYQVEFTPTLFLVGSDGSILNQVVAWDRGRYNALSQQLATDSGQPYQPLSEEWDGAPPFRPG